MKVCKYKGCGRPRCAKGLCNTHWTQKYKYGMELQPIRDYGNESCKVESCARKYLAKGFCKAHYQRYRKGLPMEEPIKEQMEENHLKTLIDVYDHIVENTVVDANECWIWQLSTTQGYGYLSFNYKRLFVHRAMCLITYGEPKKHQTNANHHCDVRRCCNPDHLYWGTQSENAYDMFERHPMYRDRRKA